LVDRGHEVMTGEEDFRLSNTAGDRDTSAACLRWVVLRLAMASQRAGRAALRAGTP
jgi:hypothetical protein